MRVARRAAKPGIMTAILVAIIPARAMIMRTVLVVLLVLILLLATAIAEVLLVIATVIVIVRAIEMVVATLIPSSVVPTMAIMVVGRIVDLCLFVVCALGVSWLRHHPPSAGARRRGSDIVSRSHEGSTGCHEGLGLRGSSNFAVVALGASFCVL